MHDGLRAELGYPMETDLEVPLLRAIARRGDMLVFSRDGDDLERELADEFGLTKYQREYSDPRFRSAGGRFWRNHIQFVRRRLVDRGMIDNSKRDCWKLTEFGRRMLAKS